MHAEIHPLAAVSPRSSLGTGTRVGPFAVIEDDVVIGNACVIESHAVIKRGSRLGDRNVVGEHVTIGGIAQHAAAPLDSGGLRIGDDNLIRENCTIHKALHAGAETVIGDGNLLMVNTHVAHDCTLDSGIVIANNVMLAGHVEVHDRAYLGGAVGIHQHCRIGKLAMVGGQARVTKDVPPYVTVDGESTSIVGLNLIGLRRSGLTNAEIAELKQAYQFIYRSGLLWAEMLEQLPLQFGEGHIAAFAEFFAGGRRGFVPERRGPVERSVIPLPRRERLDDERGKPNRKAG